MGKDILVILMIAFGLFAIVMFILFFVYLKKYYNSRHIREDYEKEIDEKIKQEQRDLEEENNLESDMEFIPIKKK